MLSWRIQECFSQSTAGQQNMQKYAEASIQFNKNGEQSFY